MLTQKLLRLSQMLIFVEGNGGRGENGGESCERVWKEGRGLHQLHHGKEEAGCGQDKTYVNLQSPPNSNLTHYERGLGVMLTHFFPTRLNGGGWR